MKLHSIILGLFILLTSQAALAQCGSKSKHNVHRSSWSQNEDLVDIVSSNESFGTLTVALKTAGLVKSLKADGPFTVFAPSNAAFAKLPEGTVETLLKPENKDKLGKILGYHVVAGNFNAGDIINAIKASNGSFEIETLSGDTLKATLSSGTVILVDEMSNRSAVLQTDINASNGIAHVIDSVVLPD